MLTAKAKSQKKGDAHLSTSTWRVAALLLLGVSTAWAELPAKPETQKIELTQAASSPKAKTFLDCYRAALRRSETVASQQEVIKQAEENYRMAIGSVLPNISGAGTYQFQQSGGLAPTIFPNPSTSSRLTVTQPLFQGFKEFAGLRQTKDLIRASANDKKQAATQLYLDTATAFFTVVADEHDIQNVNDELGYYEARIKELKHFRAIGRSQVTDLLTAQAQQASLRAQMKQLIGQLKAQRAVLAFLTGFDPDVPLVRPVETGVKARPLDAYLSRLDVRPDVLAEDERVRAAEEGIPIARAGHLPTINAQADYYLERTGALQDVHWDGIFTVALPIFSGGVVQAQVEQAVSKRDQAELTRSRVKRAAEQQVRQYYDLYRGDNETFDAYKEAVELAEKNYKEEVREYRLGLVTNLDVLTALTTFQESKRSFDKSRYSMLMDVEDLEAAGAYRPEPESTIKQSYP